MRTLQPEENIYVYLTGLFAMYSVEAGVKDKPATTDMDGMSKSTNQTASDSAPIV